MAAGVTIEDPATTYIDRDVDDRRRHDHSSGRVARRARRRSARGCEIHSGVRIVEFADRRPRHGAQPLRDHRRRGRRRRERRARSRTCATQADDRRAREGRQLRRDEEDRARRRLEVDAPGLSRRRRRSASNVNIGAGTITCNYDGVSKHTTTIEDGAFIGSDTQLIAPVTVGKGAYVGTRHDDPRGRAGRRARGQRRQAAEHRGLGRGKKKKPRQTRDSESRGSRD